MYAPYHPFENLRLPERDLFETAYCKDGLVVAPVDPATGITLTYRPSHGVDDVLRTFRGRGPVLVVSDEPHPSVDGVVRTLAADRWNQRRIAMVSSYSGYPGMGSIDVLHACDDHALVEVMVGLVAVSTRDFLATRHFDPREGGVQRMFLEAFAACVHQNRKEASDGRVPLSRIWDCMSLTELSDRWEREGTYDREGPIYRYLAALPSFVPRRGGRHSSTTLDQHGYCESVYSSALSEFVSIRDTNGDCAFVSSAPTIDLAAHVDDGGILVMRADPMREVVNRQFLLAYMVAVESRMRANDPRSGRRA